ARGRGGRPADQGGELVADRMDEYPAGRPGDGSALLSRSSRVSSEPCRRRHGESGPGVRAGPPRSASGGDRAAIGGGSVVRQVKSPPDSVRFRRLVGRQLPAPGGTGAG